MPMFLSLLLLRGATPSQEAAKSPEVQRSISTPPLNLLADSPNDEFPDLVTESHMID